MDNEENNGAPGTVVPENASSEGEELAKVTAAFADQQKRAENAEREAKELRERLKHLSEPDGTQVPDKPDPNKRIDDFEQNMELRDLGYSTEEVRYIKSVQRGSNKPIDEVLQDTFVIAAINAKRAEVAEQANAITPSHRVAGAVYNGKSYAQVVSSPQETPSDKQAAFEAQRDAILSRGRGINIR